MILLEKIYRVLISENKLGLIDRSRTVGHQLPPVLSLPSRGRINYNDGHLAENLKIYEYKLCQLSTFPL